MITNNIEVMGDLQAIIESEMESLAQELFPEFEAPSGNKIPDEAYIRVEEAFIEAIKNKIPLSDDPVKEEQKNEPALPWEETESAPELLDIRAIRKDFPILTEKVHGKDLIWFDNAATTQKPRKVIERISTFYEHENSNVHRAAHTLAARTTDAFEGARKKIASFLHADSPDEIIFVRGATEAINLVAQSYGIENLNKDDEVLITELEHHANIVPWQMVCTRTGARLRTIPVDNDGQLILSELGTLLNEKTKIVAVTHVSNAIGTITPIADIIAMAHRTGAKVLIDGAQAVAHLKIDVKALDCDFYAFSGHKVYGPMGIGVLFGKQSLLNGMQPYQGGGNMISEVTMEKTSYKSAPHRFEAGTASIADAVALGTSVEYISSLGLEAIYLHEHQLMDYAKSQLIGIPGLSIIGTAAQKTGILSFVIEDFKSEEIGKALDGEGIAVRTGHHCSQPILRRFGLTSTVRVSLAVYNTFDEVDRLTQALYDIVCSGNRLTK